MKTILSLLCCFVSMAAAPRYQWTADQTIQRLFHGTFATMFFGTNYTVAAAGGNITLRNGASGTSCVTGTTCAVTLPATLTGSAILCVFAGDSAPTVTVNDNINTGVGSYTRDLEDKTVNSSNSTLKYFSFLNSASGVTTVTATSSGSNHGMMNCGEYRNVKTSAAFDKSSTLNTLSTTPNTTNATGTLTLPGASEVLIAGFLCNFNNNCTWTQGAGYTAVGTHSGSSGAGVDAFMEYQVVTVNTTATASASWTAGGSSQGIVVSYEGQ